MTPFVGLNSAVLVVALVAILSAVGSQIFIIADAARRPDWQYQASGQNKLLWILLPCGAILFSFCCYGVVGWVVFIVYLAAVRPKLQGVARLGPSAFPYLGMGYGPPPGYMPPPMPYGQPYGPPPAPGAYGPPPAPGAYGPPPVPGGYGPPPAPGSQPIGGFGTPWAPGATPPGPPPADTPWPPPPPPPPG